MAAVTHPWASALQVKIVLPEPQEVPVDAPPGHCDGAVGHAQRALGKLPEQVVTPSQVVTEASRQPLFRAHVTSEAVLRHFIPTPVRSALAALHAGASTIAPPA